MIAERRMAGDPMVRFARRDPTVMEEARKTCLYAAAIMRKNGRLPEDMTAIDVMAHGKAEVEFVAADETQAILARFVIPERVLTYDPRPVPLPPYEGDS